MIISLENERKKTIMNKLKVEEKRNVFKFNIGNKIYYLYLYYVANDSENKKNGNFIYSEFERIVFLYDEKKGFKKTNKINKIISNYELLNSYNEPLSNEEISRFFTFLNTYNSSTEEKVRLYLNTELELINITNNLIEKIYIIVKQKQMNNANYNIYYLYTVDFFEDKSISNISYCNKDVENIYIKQLSQLVKIDYKPTMIICFNEKKEWDFICLMRLNKEYSLYVHYNQNESGTMPSIYIVKDNLKSGFWFSSDKVFSQDELNEKLNYLSSIFFI